MQTSPIILCATNVSKCVRTANQTLEILLDINLTVQKGESIAISGPSGSGKTTLLSLLCGLDVPTSGEIVFGQDTISDMDEDGRASLRAQFVGIVFQTFQLLPTLTALENVLLPLELGKKKDAKMIAAEWLAKVGLQDRAQHLPAQLSGGEQQRVAIARAFAIAPQVLFADEPTGNLDSTTGENIVNLLLEMNQAQGTTLIVVTHDDQLAKRCNRTVSLLAGRLV
ncbi:MAG: ABC transporter ATP-binding protein [Pseudomonadota bacterium]|nr:ABC transporter ATP-binding protein [Pseudomonadota bacterium]